jgi:uncharacterized SAM-dependent methyltransferase
MKDQIMTCFVALTSEPDNPAGVATYTYCGRYFELPMASFTRARELEQFLGHVVGNARRQQRQAILAQMRGAINNVEGGT